MISIIIPIYNSEKYLDVCLDSIMNQSYTDFEVICVDDGSIDTSEHICKKYVSKDVRFKYHYQDNGGVSKARNTGIDLASGEYLCFIDSDDIIHKDFLLNLYNQSQKGDIVICDYTRDFDRLGDSNSIIESHEAKTFIRKVINEEVKHPNICMMLFNTSIIKNNKLSFVVGCVRNEDAEFYLKYMSHIDNIIRTDFKGYYYRDNETSAVHQFNEKSFTYIEASSRIKYYLISKGIVDHRCNIVNASVQYFIYHLARQRNKELYDVIHTKYDVKNAMTRLIFFPRKSRRLVSLLYISLGRKLFFNIMSRILPE